LRDKNYFHLIRKAGTISQENNANFGISKLPVRQGTEEDYVVPERKSRFSKIPHQSM